MTTAAILILAAAVWQLAFEVNNASVRIADAIKFKPAPAPQTPESQP